MPDDNPSLSPEEDRRLPEVVERAWDPPDGRGLELLRAELRRAQALGDPALIAVGAQAVEELRVAWERARPAPEALVERTRREPGPCPRPRGNWARAGRSRG